MKIGILCQTLSDNYGGVLQNFALQTKLKRMGHSPITFNCWPNILPTKVWLVSTLKSCMLYWNPKTRRKFYRLKYRHDKQIEKFIHKHLVMTKESKDFRHYDLKGMGIDALIVGSDQVWRKQYNTFIWSDKFLEFAKDYPCKKIAYAASFGKDEVEFNAAEIEKIKGLIGQFDAISVREVSGVGLCKDVFGVDAVEMLDPTLLLSKDDYAQVCAEVPVEKAPFLAAYVLDMTPDKMAFINRIAKERGLVVRDFGIDSDSLTVEQWLAMYRDANFVVTDSFHGTVFSIINNKPFLSISNASRGASRFNSLLDKFELSDRIVLDINSYKQPADIDWAAFEHVKSEWQEKSMEFLRKNL